MQTLRADYVIVGAGTAGCVLAARLSEDSSKTVLLLEAGPKHRGLDIQIPAGIRSLYKKARYHWNYTSQPEPFAAGKTLPYKMGRIVGGSSAINGMIWVRGHPKDFDDWAAAGCVGWDYQSVEPIFRRIETFEDRCANGRGADGPIHVSTCKPDRQPLSRAFLQAARQAGEPINPDYNCGTQDGFCALQHTIRNGRRSDVYAGYLKPALKRRNIRVMSDVTVTRILSEGKDVTGVEGNGKFGPVTAIADREVILCGGAIGSPQLLELSGIGDFSVLTKAGVGALVHDLPGVGENLHTHPAVSLAYLCSRPVSILNATRGLGKLAAGIRWLALRTGPAATPHFEAGAFVRARPDADRPDCFLIFLPLLMEGGDQSASRHGFQVFIDLYGVRSRGHTHIAGSDIARQPNFRFNALSAPGDVAALRMAIARVRHIIRQPAMQAVVAEEIRPGPERHEAAGLDEWIRNTLSRSHHLAGSCKMGPATDPTAVVGPDLKVHGIHSLRVADCSIMPSVTTGNTHAGAILIGEKAAELIAAQNRDQRLASVSRSPGR